MPERLTDQTELTDAPETNDVVYVVDVSDTTDDPAGSSKKQTLANFAQGIPSFKQIGVSNVFVFKTIGDNYTIVQAGDLTMFMTQTRLVMGYAITNLAIIPDDFDDPAKFAKFIDNDPAL